MTCCGIPQIKLEGNLNDWINLKLKTIKLIEDYNFNTFIKDSMYE
jgi:hypothetical protein